MNSLLAGISGLRAHQTMLDVTGNNLANLNTFAFKSSRVSFAQLLGSTLRPGSAPSATTGGTNPVQVTTGVTISSIDRNMEQGSMLNTGRDLDLSIEGAGYFTLNDGEKDVYSRVGSFTVDSQYNLVDPATGYRVQRMGSTGVADGFQSSFSNDIRIPYDVALPAKATESITFTGNLRASEQAPATNVMTLETGLTVSNAVADDTTLLKDLDQTSGWADGDEIRIYGTNAAGTAVDTTWTIADITHATNATLGALLTQIDTAFAGSTTELKGGKIRLNDDVTGFSLTDINLEFLPTASGTGTFEKAGFFSYTQAGGEETKAINVEVFDAQGISHTLSATFVRHEVASNTWDMVLTGITGGVDQLVDRRIRDIEFQANGSYAGLNSVTGDTLNLTLKYSNDPTNTHVIAADFGTAGAFNGLTQFGGASTVVPSEQDGYAPGWLSSLSVSRDGVLAGTFTNGIRRDIADLRITIFQNAAGLDSQGGGYFIESANSGIAVPTKAMSGGSGAVRGGSLEKANVDVATEFVNLIQAQNGFQASARTIRISNEMLQELSQLIR